MSPDEVAVSRLTERHWPEVREIGARRGDRQCDSRRSATG
jgi:hypothetical protein